MDLGVVDRTAVVIALDIVATVGKQKLFLETCFDTFGDQVKIQAFGQGNDRSDDRCVFQVIRNIDQEGTVDFECVDRQPLLGRE
jgi:hypothetical protein